MSQSRRILIAILIIGLIGGVVLGIDWYRRQSFVPATPAAALAPQAVSPASAGTASAALGADAIATGAPAAGAFAVTPITGGRIVAGGIPIYYQGTLLAAFTPADLEGLSEASFVDPVENKPQTGWLVSEILLSFFTPDQLTPDTTITFISESRGKSATLTWAEVSDPQGYVMFDVSNRGTLKLVSQLEKLDERDEWVQDTEKIDVGAGATP
jgi:hypothetical protein